MAASSRPKLPSARTDKWVGLAVGFSVPGAALALLMVGIAQHWPGPAKTATQIVLFAAIVWTMIIFPKWWTRRKVRRLRGRG